MMTLIYKGRYKSEDQLPKGNLPANAVRFKEPDSPGMVNLVAGLISIPVIIVVIAVALASARWHGGIVMNPNPAWNLPGILMSFLIMVPHEFLHAVWFGRQAEVELYIAPSKMMMFVISTQPISKGRFIWLSLFPNLVLGWLPFLIWTVMPDRSALSNLLLFFSVFTILMGGGDYMNIFNALRQMPKGSMQQLSGFHSYWYMP
jgi:hypothetical protein